jgi:hypothetical protein
MSYFPVVVCCPLNKAPRGSRQRDTRVHKHHAIRGGAMSHVRTVAAIPCRQHEFVRADPHRAVTHDPRPSRCTAAGTIKTFVVAMLARLPRSLAAVVASLVRRAWPEFRNV